MKNKKVLFILFIALFVFTMFLGGCGKKTEEEKPVETPTNNETAEKKDETIISKKPAFAQIDWSKYQILQNDITVFGKPGSELKIDDLFDFYPSGLVSLRSSSFASIDKSNLHELNDYLLLVDEKGKDNLYFSLREDIILKNGTYNMIEVGFPIYGKNIRFSDALKSNCWAFCLKSAAPKSEILSPIGIKKIEMPYREGFGDDPYYYAEAIKSFMDKNGAPTGLLYNKEVGNFFDPEVANPYAKTKYDTSYILYWERDSYVVAISLKELVGSNNLWGIRLEEHGNYYTKSAWDTILKSELNPTNKSFNHEYVQVLFSDFNNLIELANNITNIYAQSN